MSHSEKTQSGTRRYTGLVGNSNAVKRPGKPADTSTSFRCNLEDKAKWEAEAERDHVSMSDLIVSVLNAEMRRRQDRRQSTEKK